MQSREDAQKTHVTFGRLGAFKQPAELALEPFVRPLEQVSGHGGAAVVDMRWSVQDVFGFGKDGVNAADVEAQLAQDLDRCEAAAVLADCFDNRVGHVEDCGLYMCRQGAVVV